MEAQTSSWTFSARLFQGLAWLVVAGLVVEFYFAGAALFGVTTFDLHRLMGLILGVAILLLLGAALVARPGRRALGQVALLVVLTVVQMALPSLRTAVPALAALHVVNAAVLLGLAADVARMAGRAPAASAASKPLTAATSTR